MTNKKMNPSNSLNKNNQNPQFKKIINDAGCSEKAADAIRIWYENSKQEDAKNPQR
jgi:hypothetical protein